MSHDDDPGKPPTGDDAAKSLTSDDGGKSDTTEPAPASQTAADLESVIAGGDAVAVAAHLDALPPDEMGYQVNRLDAETRTKLLELLSAQHARLAATLFEHLVDEQAADLISVLPPDAAAAIVEVMDSDDQADIFIELDRKEAEAILGHMDPEEADDVRRLAAHEPDTAGGLMITEYLSHRKGDTVANLLSDLQTHAEEYSGYDVQYVYVTDDDGVLVGVIRLRDLVMTPGDRTLSSILIPAPAMLTVSDSQDQCEHFFDHHPFFAAPVVDAKGRLVGVVRRAAVERAHAEKADKALLQFGGIIGGDELRAMPWSTRVLRRLAFLCPNILLNLLAAAVVAHYEPTIAAVTALAIFLPMLSDMSGCAGNQAVAVSIRELSLGLLKPADVAHTLGKEVGIGVINGVVLGALIGGIAWVMRGDDWPKIGLVVGAAMAINSVVAVTIGSTVPLFLKRTGVDPALASSPILTTVTDMCGFFLTLSLATSILL